MHELSMYGLTIIVKVLEIICAAVIIIGFLIATIRWCYSSLQLKGGQPLKHYSKSIGRITLIGLEVLVAATIINSIIIDRDLESLSLLAITVSIRTLIGWTTELEINHRWPWQKAAKSK